MNVNTSNVNKTSKKETFLFFVAALFIVGIFYVFLTQYLEDNNRPETISEQQSNLNSVEDSVDDAEVLKKELMQQRKDISASEKKEEKKEQLESSVTEDHKSISVEESDQKRLIIESFL